MSDDKKYGKGKNPNSLKNLKPVKPGENRNPLGGRAHNPVQREMRKFTSELLSEMIQLAVMGNLAELKKVAEDPNTPAIQVGIAKVLFDGISKGNWDVVEKLLARTIGKVPDKIDHTSDGKPLGPQTLSIKFVDDGTN